MQSAFERSRDEVNALERERNKLQEEVERLTAEYRDSED
jgi:prefoldin subunit 5